MRHVFHRGELAINRLLEHDVLDDILLGDAEFLGLLGNLLVDERRAHELGQMTLAGPPCLAPSWDIFERQPREYRDSVLPPEVTARVAIEQASTLGWDRYVGAAGRVVGMHTFGASAPLKELQKKFGFEPEHVVALAKEVLDGN